ncbi:MAG: type I phosphomannose isomerase catalytic subunit [Oligoflexales bacterium]
MHNKTGLFDNIIPLSFNNFTPLTRTPWGGKQIFETYKRQLPGVAQTSIGESWEFSCDAHFPSKLLTSSATLQSLVDEFPAEVLSRHRVEDNTCQLLVKLINARDPLSIQVHPEDADAHLKPDECGKPESWLILDVEPGAGVYLGFANAVSKDEIRRALQRNEDISTFLQFVTVKPYDYFEIKPGLVHAIGPGITLLEPQRITAGKSGKTYRVWDWGRRYDSKGMPDPKGTLRDLHIEQALNVIEPEKKFGAALLEEVRVRPIITRMGQATVRAYSANAYYQTNLFSLESEVGARFALEDGYGVLTVLGGAIKVKGKSKDISLSTGQTALVPAALRNFYISAATSGGATFSLIVSSGSRFHYESPLIAK